MQTYSAPLADFRFLLEEVFDYPGSVAALPGYEDAPLDTALAVLDEAAAFAESVLLPLNASGDREGCHFAAGTVATPEGFRAAHDRLVEGGWCGIAIPGELGGSGLPEVLSVAFEEITCSANLAFAVYPLLTSGTANALCIHGSDDQIARFVPHLAAGDWSGTMCLTEAHARHRPRPAPDPRGAAGRRHLRASREPRSSSPRRARSDRQDRAHGAGAGARRAAGTRGISLFIVPKFLVGEDGEPGARNGVMCGSIEHKMGIRARPPACCTSTAPSAELIGSRTPGMRAHVHDDEPRAAGRGRAGPGRRPRSPTSRR